LKAEVEWIALIATLGTGEVEVVRGKMRGITM
jgi:hypothetical protein